MAKPSRKTLAPWLTAHRGTVVKQVDQDFCTWYVVEEAAGKTAWLAINKKGKLYDYTRNRGRDELTINYSIFTNACQLKMPVRMAVCYQGQVWVHGHRDLRETTPENRMVANADGVYDPEGCVWFPFAEFANWTDGMPVARDPDAEPAAPPPPPNIIDLLMGRS